MRIVLVFLFLPLFLSAQTWVDSLNNYAMEKFLPASKYSWTWQKAPFLRAVVDQYALCSEEKQIKYLNYVKKAMKKSAWRANGRWPNGVASGHGMAFLWKTTNKKKYKKKAEKIYRQYLKSSRVKGGGVSHLPTSPELWDDTIYMIGIYLMEMYRATKEEKYITELVEQIRIHREKLRDEKWGLWVHAWDANSKTHATFCGCRNWANQESRKSQEIWARGTAWIVVVLSDLVKTLDPDHLLQEELRGYLKEMIIHLPKLQDQKTGHWKQLPTKPNLKGNFIESSASAMFAYGILTALQNEIVEGEAYELSIDLAYEGLRKYSIKKLKNAWLTTQNVCIGTCVGDEKYYLKRKVTTGKPFAIGVFLIFGIHYELEKNLRE